MAPKKKKIFKTENIFTSFKIPVIITKMLLNWTGLRHARKVFVIGFNKTGTSSIHIIFKNLGLPSYHGGKWRSCNNLKLLRLYDCFSDGTPRDLIKLDQMFPNSKFILQVRELETWILSRLSHIERSKRTGKHKGVATWDVTEYAVRTWIENRNRYHIFVLNYFLNRKQNILIINYTRDSMASQKICQFLGYKKIIAKPHKNINPSRIYSFKHVEMLLNCANMLGIPEHELKYDIFCPGLTDMNIYGALPYDTSLLSERWQPQSNWP
jgi:hypothetical protein